MPNVHLLHMQISNYLICIYINNYENIKNVIHDWGFTYKINTISDAYSNRLLKWVLTSLPTHDFFLNFAY